MTTTRMANAHELPQHGGGAWEALWPVAVLAAAAAVYLILAGLRRREPRGWSAWRTGAFLTGLALLVLALVPQLSPFPAGAFHGHMYQHLVIGMYAPLGLVLGAPVTLLLRSVRPSTGRAVGRVLRSRAAHLIANPVTALVLNLGGLAVLYFTPLYDATAATPALHHLAHVHFLAAGYLFAWVIAGPDPSPRRPSVPARLVVLGVAILGHAVLAQLIYAGALVQVTAPVGQLRAGGDLMYFGGDIAELLLALVLVSTWRPRRGAPRVMPQPAAAATS
jgi:putative membrane protein